MELKKIPNDLKISIISDIMKIIKDSDVYDISDIGNLIGIAVAKYLNENMGFEKEDFINGIKHGISLVDGSHPKQ